MALSTTGCDEPAAPTPVVDGGVYVVVTGLATYPSPIQLTLVVNEGRLTLGEGTALHVTPLSPGLHRLAVEGVPEECVLSDSPRTVPVHSARTTVVEFTVRCPVRIEASNWTVGLATDPDGYVVEVRERDCYYEYYCTDSLVAVAPIAPNGSTVLGSTLLGGMYLVSLTDVAANCAVSASPAGFRRVESGSTHRVSFLVECSASGASAGTEPAGADRSPEGV